MTIMFRSQLITIESDILIIPTNKLFKKQSMILRNYLSQYSKSVSNNEKCKKKVLQHIYASYKNKDPKE